MKNQKHTRVFSILLAVCMLVSLLPAGMLSVSAADTVEADYLFLTSSSEAQTLTAPEGAEWAVTDGETVVSVEGDQLTALVAGTATVTATDAAGAAVKNVYVVVDDNPHYYYNLGKASKGSTSSNVVAFADMGYAQTTKGSPDEVVSANGYIETDPWKYGTQTEGAQADIYAFNVGSAQTSLYMRGYHFVHTADTDYSSVIVNVPAEGTYDVKIHHVLLYTNSPVIKYAKAGHDIDNAIELSALNSYADVTSTLNGFTTTVGQVTLEAGEYEFFITGATEHMWIDAIELINVAKPYVAPKFVVMEAVYGETIVPDMTVPDGYNAVLSTDSDLITINNDGTITCGTENGTAVVKLSTEESSEAYSTMLIEIGGTAKFDYIKSLKTGAAKDSKISLVANETALMKTYDVKDIDPTRQYISYGWMAPADSAWTMNNDTNKLGLYFKTTTGSYTTMVIDVPAAGKYQVYSNHSLWNAGGAQFDLYIAPTTEADNIISDQYKVNRTPFDVTFAEDNKVAKLYTFYAGVANLEEAGSYTVAYRAVNAGSGFFVGGLTLQNVLGVSEVAATALNLTAASTFINKGATTYLTAAVEPAEAEGWVTYKSSDDEVATVDANGVVTGVGAGTATITAAAGGITKTIDITVCDKVYDYAFKDLGVAYSAANSNATTYFYEAPFTDLTWTETYGDYSSPWFFKTTNVSGYSIQYIPALPQYGAFVDIGASDKYMTFQVHLEEGVYSTELVQYMATPAAATAEKTSGSIDVDLYVVPTGAGSYYGDDYKVMNVVSHDYGGARTDRAEKTIALAAGDYYITLKNAGTNNGRYSYLHNIRLYRVGDVKVESFELTAADMVKVNETTTVSAVNMVPSFETLEGATWTSSNTDVATVANGVVTGVAGGTATITAEIDGVTASIDITVYSNLLEYEFYEVGKNYDADGDGTPEGSTIFKSVPAFVAGYEASQSTTAAFAPWMYVSAEGNFNSADTYGTFMFSATDGTIQSVVLKIKVETDGEYTPAATRHIYGSSTPATVHIAPVADEENKTDDIYYVYTITDEGSGTAEEIADTSIMLKAGEYYLTFQHAVPSSEANRYLNLFDFRLYKVGEYVPVKAESVSVSSNMAAIGIGETATMYSTVLPGRTEDKSVTWSSSADKIATVDANGVVTGIGNGIVTITATANDGSGVTDSADIIVGGTYTYDFDGIITEMSDYDASKNYYAEESVLATDYNASVAAGSAPWMVDSVNAADLLYVPSLPNYNLWLFGHKYPSTEGMVRMKIKVEESGIYTGALRYVDQNTSAPVKIYLSPIEHGTENIETDANLIYDLSHEYVPVTEQAALTDALSLNAGEYYLVFRQNGEATYIQSSEDVNGDDVVDENDKKLKYDHRYFNVSYFSLTKTEDLGLVTLTDGAQMRTKDPQGLRFIASIDKTNEAFENNQVTEYGIVLLPAEDIAEGDKLEVGYAANGHTAVAVRADRMYAETDYKNTFTAVLIDIPDDSLNRKIAARAYAKLSDGTYVYSDLTVERSIYEIALAITQNANATDADKTAAQAIVDKVNPPAAQ